MSEENKQIDEIKKIFESTGINTVYGKQKEKIEPPYICFYFLENVVFYADGVPYYKRLKIAADLYTRFKSPEIEKKLEDKIGKFTWTKEENFLEDENVYKISYEMEVQDE